jgi:hypothetical protein
MKSRFQAPLRRGLAAAAGFLALGLLPSVANAAPMFVYNGAQLTGITGLTVSGTAYNVSFVEGNCERLRTDCLANDPRMGNSLIDQSTAEASQDALLNAFQTTAGFRVDTVLTGCAFVGNCRLTTAYQTNISSTAGAVVVPPGTVETTLMEFAHFNLGFNGIFLTYGFSTANTTATLSAAQPYDSALDNRSVYALWEAVTPVGGGTPTPGSVPEPGSLALAGLALGGLAWVRRRTAQGPAAA